MSNSSNPVRPLWIGTFPVAGIGTPSGRGEGIWRTDLDLVTGELSPAEQVCEAPAPSFLVLDRAHGLLHATAEADPEGSVTSWQIHDRALEPRGAISSGGSSPTHLSALPGLLLVSNYGDGTVGALVLDEAGLPRELIRLPHSGSGPVADRQEGSHAHSTLPTPAGRVALACDLGTDELRRLPLGGRDASQVREDGVAFRFTPGSGPRHAVFRRGSALVDVVTELSAELVTLAWDGRDAEQVSVVPAGPPHDTDDQPSHLAPSADGRLLYVAHRGAGTLAVAELPTADASDPTPVLLGETPVGSTWPRHFAVVRGANAREFIVVAGERAGRIHVLVRDPGERLPRPCGTGGVVPSPAFILAG